MKHVVGVQQRFIARRDRKNQPLVIQHYTPTWGIAFLEKGAHMFKEPPDLLHPRSRLIFLIVFGAISFATWMVWLTAISFFAKLVVTAIGFLLAAMTVILYTISAE